MVWVRKILLEQAGHAQKMDNPDTGWTGDDPVDAYYIKMGIELYKEDSCGEE